MKKKEILTIIDSLEKINDSVTRNLESNISVTTEVLVDCQDAAIEIGNEIEKRVSDGEEIVRMLEAYCEKIYQMNCVQADINLCRKLAKKIKKQLVQIRNSVKYGLLDEKKQVVFLPYKASMWDSLESVWKAADADPNCDAYVIPIPYFDKNPDGSFREMHYEGTQYPDYVPIVSWQEYDISAEHPDAIYIHNPYDEYNLVTSVHPAYYSKELKKYTDKLVYIPYFILEEAEPDNLEDVKGMEHFCTVPAVVHADKVIVQSEKMRQIYINVMSNTMGEDTKKIWEKKILGLGSPKLDRVVNTRKGGQEIPAEWLKNIEKSDGSWKKIIFYNTSVSNLLRHSGMMLQKMEYVFSLFKDYKDDVTLLWRPHPLMRATIESMRPQLCLEYDKLISKYREENWGIYDDTPDIDRAIAISDAYYGDSSSVVQMYEKTGKPIMIQNVEILQQQECLTGSIGIGDILEKGKLHLQYRSGIRVGDKFYFSEIYFNALFEMDINSFFVRFICHFEGEIGTRILLHTDSAIQYNNIIYFLPFSGKYVHAYDLITREVYSVFIPIDDEEFLTAGTAQRGNKMWLFPLDISIGVFVLNMEERTITRADKINELLLRYGKTRGWIDIPEEGKMFTFCVNDSILLKIDLEKEQIEEYKAPFENADVNLINYHEGMFYFTDIVTGDLYEWSCDNTYLKKFVTPCMEKLLSEPYRQYIDKLHPYDPYIGCCFVNDDIYMIPWASKYVMKVQKDKGIMEKAFDYPEDFRYLDNRRTDYMLGLMMNVEVVHNEIWFHPCGGNELLIYDTISGQVTGREMFADVCSIFPCKGKSYENNLRPLDYLCYGFKESEQNSMEKEELCGEKIYEASM